MLRVCLTKTRTSSQLKFLMTKNPWSTLLANSAAKSRREDRLHRWQSLLICLDKTEIGWSWLKKQIIRLKRSNWPRYQGKASKKEEGWLHLAVLAAPNATGTSDGNAEQPTFIDGLYESESYRFCKQIIFFWKLFVQLTPFSVLYMDEEL